MKRKLLSLSIILLLGVSVYAQDSDKIKILFEEGISLHDAGDYNGAIKKYEEALRLDEDNISLLAEKAFSLLSLNDYEGSIKTCKLAIKKDPKSESLKFVYTTYANALDTSKNPKKAIKIYNEGIDLFPDYFQLHFNKGITLAKIKNYDEALISFQSSISVNPEHASSHNAIGRIMSLNNKNIPSLLAFCRFLVIEPQGTRAKSNLPFVQKVMKANVEKTGDTSITININSNLLSDIESKKNEENNFSTVELILSMSAALDYDKKNKDKTEIELFMEKFETVCSSLKESQKNNYGFYWEYYVPYFIEMKERDLIETFSYLIYASSDNEYVNKWLDKNKNEIDSFYSWSDNFSWN